MSTFLKPRHYDDVEVPIFNGQPLYTTNNQKEYKFYVNWLADHLYQNPQDEIDKTAELEKRKFNARCLGGDAVLHEMYCFSGYIPYFIRDLNYDDTFKGMQKEHQEIYKDETDPDSVDPFEEWINPEIWDNAVREYQASKDIEAEHSDIGYRQELSQCLSGIKKHEDRYAILDDFFISYWEDACK
jgi:hypothetical protein